MQEFKTTRMLQSHKRRTGHWGSAGSIPCSYCHRRFDQDSDLQAHLDADHFHHFQIVKNAFSHRLETAQIVFDDGQCPSLEVLFSDHLDYMLEVLTAFLREKRVMIFSTVVHAR